MDGVDELTEQLDRDRVGEGDVGGNELAEVLAAGGIAEEV